MRRSPAPVLADGASTATAAAPGTGRFARLQAFGRCRSGNFALIVGLLAPMVLGLAGGAVDLLVYQHHRNELQDTADAAVLAAASEAGLKGWSENSAKQAAASVLESNLTNKFSGVTFAYDLKVNMKDRWIDLHLTQDHYGYFFIGYFTGSPQIEVRSTARATGQATICVIVRSPSDKEALTLSGESRLSATGCSAYSNSVAPQGITTKDTSQLITQLACSAGGYAGKPSNYTPLPVTDCPPLADPLATRAAVVDASIKTTCDYKKVKIDGIKKTLLPGTYCDDLEIKDKAQVTFEPGIYVIKDGKLKVDGASSVSGDKVGFVFVGDKARLEFKNDSSISLSAPSAGPMAGILMYAKAPSKQRDFKIESKDAQKLIGTVYLPGDVLVIGGDGDGDGACDPVVADDGTVTPAPADCLSDVGAASSWTAIVTKKLKVTAGSKLVLNSDYASSDVPVPDGLGPNSSRVRLTN